MTVRLEPQAWARLSALGAAPASTPPRRAASGLGWLWPYWLLGMALAWAVHSNLIAVRPWLPALVAAREQPPPAATPLEAPAPALHTEAPAAAAGGVLLRTPGADGAAPDRALATSDDATSGPPNTPSREQPGAERAVSEAREEPAATGRTRRPRARTTFAAARAHVVPEHLAPRRRSTTPVDNADQRAARPAAPSARGYAAGGTLPSCEAARAAYRERIRIGPRGGPPDISRAAYAAVLDRGSYLAGCDVPERTVVTICAAVQHGRAAGITVHTSPQDARVARCVAAAVGRLAFPTSERLDVTTTVFSAR